MICNRKSKMAMALIFSLAFLLAACGGQPAKPEKQAEAQKPDPPLAKKYQNIVVHDLSATPEIKKGYPEALKECQSTLIGELANQRRFKSVALGAPGKKCPPRTLLVQARVSDIHIVHGAARFWGGAFAGSSYINIDLKLSDAATGKLLREKKISSGNNAWAAAWVGGSTDRTLPSDMGKIVAGYIGSIMPK